jgi:general L-amino acid transport system permease protein
VFSIYLALVFGAVGFFIAKNQLRFSSGFSLLIGFVSVVVYFFFIAGPFITLFKYILPINLMFIESLQFGGFLLSMIVGFSGIAASFPIGILLALGRQSDLPLVKMICVGFIEFIRGVPLITLLFVASVLLNYFLPPGTSFDIIIRVIIMVTIFSAAYMAEVIRGGLAALPVGQHEASAALGLSYWQAQRLIIMPQALKISIPGIVNTFIGLFKDTTLVSIISLLDPVGLASLIRADQKWNGIYWELYVAIGLLFFVCCFGMSQYSQYLERKLKTDNS